MGDIFDIAQERDIRHREESIARHREKQAGFAVSAFFCEECGDPIPEPRRLAVTGCRCCIDCQKDLDRYGKTRFTSPRA